MYPVIGFKISTAFPQLIQTALKTKTSGCGSLESLLGDLLLHSLYMDGISKRCLGVIKRKALTKVLLQSHYGCYCSVNV